MKMEFNPDGSLKLPECIVKQKENDYKIFQDKPCIKIIKNQISVDTPLTCELQINASDKLAYFNRIEFIYKQATDQFKHKANLSIRKVNEREYAVTIISGMYRCSWCKNFRSLIGEEMDVKVINSGSCLDSAYSIKH